MSTAYHSETTCKAVIEAACTITRIDLIKDLGSTVFDLLLFSQCNDFGR